MHGAEASDVIVDGGWTPPFDRNRFVLSYGGAILGATTRDPGLNALNEPGYQQGTASIASGVLTRRHPAAGRAAPGERPHSLPRGRAHRRRRCRDRLALPYAVCVERVCRHLRPRPYQRHGMASAFPITWWYVNRQRVKCQPRLADSSFPMTSWNAINTGALRVYPAISVGASAHGGSPQTPDNKPIGVIYRQPYTVGPPSTGGGTDQWQLRLGRPASAFTCGFRLRIGVTPPTASVIDIVRQRPLPALATHSGVEGHEPYLTLARAAIRVCFGNSPREVVMSAEVAAEETRGPGPVGEHRIDLRCKLERGLLQGDLFVGENPTEHLIDLDFTIQLRGARKIFSAKPYASASGEINIL
jgi:hypothetical protein